MAVTRGRYAPDLLRARISNNRRIVVAAVLGAFLVVFFVVVAIAQGIGHPSVPSGDVALVQDVPNGDIPMAEFQGALEQAAARQGAKNVPAPSDPSSWASLRRSCCRRTSSYRSR